MKRYKMLAVALLALAVATFTMASCSNSNDDDSSGGSSTENVTYSGSYTAGGNTYTSLKLTGTSAGGDATLSGASPTLSGTYTANSALSARTLSLSGTYIITFGNIDGVVMAVFSSGGGTVILSGGVEGSGTADGGSGTTVTDSELAGYTYFYYSASGLREALIFDNKGTLYTAMNISTGTTLKAALSEYINDDDDYSFTESSYTFTEGTGAVEGEGLYFGLQPYSNIPDVAIQYDGKLYLVPGNSSTAIEKGNDYYTAANFQTIKGDITAEFDKEGEKVPHPYKVDSTFTAN